MTHILQSIIDGQRLQANEIKLQRAEAKIKELEAALKAALRELEETNFDVCGASPKVFEQIKKALAL